MLSGLWLKTRLIIIVLKSWEQENKNCPIDKYDGYATLQLAKEACSSDSKCKALVDNDCDGAGPISLCSSTSSLYSSTKHCIYVKQGKTQIRFIAVTKLSKI